MKKLKHIIAILCIVLCFIPATAYAKSDVSVSDVYASFKLGNSVYQQNVKLPFRIDTQNKAKDLNAFQVQFKIKDKLHNGDQITLDKKYYNYWSEVSYSVLIAELDSKGRPISEHKRVYNSSSQTIEQYNAPITIDIPGNYNNGVLVTLILVNKITYPAWEEKNIILGLDYLTYDIEYKTNGLLGDIIEYIKGIFQKITEIPHKIGEFISGLGDRIGNFFTDLWDKITTKFNELETNIKNWWSNLSQSIKDWWVNLTNSIRNWWTNLTSSIKNWWQSIIDYLKSLFVPDPNYWGNYKDKVDLFMKEHFGFLYQSGDLIVSLFQTIKNGISNASASGVIHIPEIKWIFTKNSVLVPATEFNLDTIVNANSFTKTVFNMIKIAFNALICYSVVLLGKKKFDEIILDREVL